MTFLRLNILKHVFTFIYFPFMLMLRCLAWLFHMLAPITKNILGIFCFFFIFIDDNNNNIIKPVKTESLQTGKSSVLDSCTSYEV